MPGRSLQPSSCGLAQLILKHEAAKAELKNLVPADAQQAFGHGVRAKRSKSGAISFDLLKSEGEDAAGE